MLLPTYLVEVSRIAQPKKVFLPKLQHLVLLDIVAGESDQWRTLATLPFSIFKIQPTGTQMV
jgi:hypothetical protein